MTYQKCATEMCCSVVRREGMICRRCVDANKLQPIAKVDTERFADFFYPDLKQRAQARAN